VQVSELKTALRRYGFDESDPLLTWLNAAYLNWVLAAYNWPFLEAAPYSMVASSGVATLVLPANADRIVTVKEQTHGEVLKYYERTKFEREIADHTVTGTPRYFTVTGLTGVELWPVPDISTNLRIVYLESRNELVDDSDVPDCPANLHYAIVQAAAAIALQAENEEERAQTAEEQANNSINRVWSKYAGARTKGEDGTVTDAMGYGGSYGY
jgi:hypothetical protein